MGGGRQRPARRALVLAGGGIVGGLYEVGALLALDSVCEDFSTCDFDLYVGSSAGAFVAALLANRVSAERLRVALESDQRTLPRLSVSRFMSLPWRSYLGTAPRLAAALRRLVGDLWAHWDEAFVLDTATSLLRVLPRGIFSLDGLERYVRSVLTQAGRTNDFRRLRRRRRAVRGRRPGAPHRDPPPPPRRPRAPRLHEPGDRLRAPRALRARPAALRLPADDVLAAPRGDPARVPDDGEDDPGRLRAVRGGVRARPGDTAAAAGDRAAGASAEPRLRRAGSGESGALAGSHRGAERALSRLSTFLPSAAAPEGGARVLPLLDPGYRLERIDARRRPRHQTWPVPH